MPSEDHDYQQIMAERERVEVLGEPFVYLTAVLGLFGRGKDDLDIWSEALENLCADAGIVIERRLAPQEIEALDRAYFNCFSEAGIRKDDNQTLRHPAPLLADLHRHLLALNTPASSTLTSVLYPMALDMESEAFNCRINIDIRSNPLVVFGLKDVSGEVKARTFNPTVSGHLLLR